MTMEYFWIIKAEDEQNIRVSFRGYGPSPGGSGIVMANTE